MKNRYCIFIFFLLTSCSHTDPKLYADCFEKINSIIMDTSFTKFSGESNPYILKNNFDSIAPCMTSLDYKEVYFTQEHTGDSMIVIIVRRGTRIEFFPNSTINKEMKTHTIKRVKIRDQWYYTTYFW